MSARSQRAPRLAPEVRRRQLLDAALAVLSEGGSGSVSIEAVARRAGVTRPVIYDVFGDLEGLMLALIDRAERNALASVLEIVSADPGHDVDPEVFLVESVQAFLRAVKDDPRTWRLVLMPPRGSSQDLRERLHRSRRLIADRVATLLDWGVPRRGGPLGLDHPLAARLIVAAAEDAARLMLAQPRRFGPERLAALTRSALTLLPVETGIRDAAVCAPSRGASAPTPGPARDSIPLAPASDSVGAAGMAPVPAAVGQRRRVPQAERREQLLDVTLSLLAEDGFQALSMESIARRAAVNRTVVYRSFANLNVLLGALLHREDRRIRQTLNELLPRANGDREPGVLLGETLERFLAAVISEPRTWRVALLRPESAPLALQKLVNRRRATLAHRLEPLVRWGLSGGPAPGLELDVEVLSRMLLSIGEEQARLALDDPEFPPERLLAGTLALVSQLPLRAGAGWAARSGAGDRH